MRKTRKKKACLKREAHFQNSYSQDAKGNFSGWEDKAEFMRNIQNMRKIAGFLMILGSLFMTPELLRILGVLNTARNPKLDFLFLTGTFALMAALVCFSIWDITGPVQQEKRNNTAQTGGDADDGRKRQPE